MNKIDRILISLDDSPLYTQYLPIYSMACEKIIGVKPTLAYVGNEIYPDWMKKYCKDIFYFKPNPEVGCSRSMSFVIRMFIRYIFNDEFCMVGDIDLIPLNKSYFDKTQNLLDKNKFISIGYNIMEKGDGDSESPKHGPELRKFPSCYTIATSNIWKEIVNPDNLSNEELVLSWKHIEVYDHKEDVSKDNFCDESLMRLLIQRWNPTRDRVLGVNRESWDRLDRSRWASDLAKLGTLGFIDAHCPRPLAEHQEIKQITDYLGIPFIIGG